MGLAVDRDVRNRARTPAPQVASVVLAGVPTSFARMRVSVDGSRNIPDPVRKLKVKRQVGPAQEGLAECLALASLGS